MPEKMWFGKPDSWWDDPTWQCEDGHVSKYYLKSEKRGPVCLAGGCYKPLDLVSPDTKEKIADVDT